MAFKKKLKKSFSSNNVENTLHKNIEFTAIEQYKLLRANLSFTLPADVKCPIIGVSSSIRGEGKSTTAINLSYVLAENGKKVLLLDADLRIPSIAKKMDMNSSPGLTDFLMDYDSQQLSVFKSKLLENWYILPSGNLPPNPSELLASNRMKAFAKTCADTYDYVIFDAPPINTVADAQILSSYTDGVILVARSGSTTVDELNLSAEALQRVGGNLCGVVLNDMTMKSVSWHRRSTKCPCRSIKMRLSSVILYRRCLMSYVHL